MESRHEMTIKEIDNVLGRNKRLLDKFIKKHNREDVVPITRNIYLVYEGDPIYEIMLEDCARGMCSEGDGNIYIRDGVEISAHLLIHEFIHRVSRNYIDGNWQFAFGAGEYGWGQFGEVITEFITTEIIGKQEERNVYVNGFDIIRLLCRKISKRALYKAYFDADTEFLKTIFGDYYEPFRLRFENFMLYLRVANSQESISKQERIACILNSEANKADLQTVIKNIPWQRRLFSK